MGNYRLTTRGKVVLVIFIALILYIPYRLFLPDNTPVESPSPELPLVDSVSEEAGVDVASNPIEEEDVMVDKEPSDKNPIYSDEELFILSSIYNFYFEPNTDVLLEDSKVLLSNFMVIDSYLIIEGHINGHPDYNDSAFGISLAENRADKVKDMLMELGVPESLIIVRNHGSNYPINEDVSESELSKNRRVTVYYKDFKSKE